ncbi:MAG: hypothetical protein SFU56_19455 [Capsulimonadales bacterium]|nr:hypothetical protein [Capsulimonadales bacterium]
MSFFAVRVPVGAKLTNTPTGTTGTESVASPGYAWCARLTMIGIRNWVRSHGILPGFLYVIDREPDGTVRVRSKAYNSIGAALPLTEDKGAARWRELVAAMASTEPVESTESRESMERRGEVVYVR